MSTERRLSRSFHSCLKGSSTEEAVDEEESCYHSLGGRHTLNRQPQVYVEDLSNVTLADFETTQDDIDETRHKSHWCVAHLCRVKRPAQAQPPLTSASAVPVPFISTLFGFAPCFRSAL
ncbi:unnamed protein product [Parnassius apollo]|uniref:(apollo) hypothetical protein n=1 Tax=Parnassius apollo TaxID=110799 RepID=A0A8S3XUQ2_PARAO|nr:unnamed protein product [Parnassius apollo]